MRYDIRESGTRAHTVTQQAVSCPNALDHDKQTRYGVKAKPGNWVTFREARADGDGTPLNAQARCGRVLGRVEGTYAEGGRYPMAACNGYLSVLALSDALQHAYVRWVKPEDVIEVSAVPPAKLLAWITGTLPDPVMVHRLSHYGSLSESYIDKANHHVNAWTHGVSPTAWDSGLRSPAAVEADRAKPLSAELLAKLGRTE